MAEISGNNIRSLESFCERCANLSSEREAAGAELTAEDIDRVAKIYFNTAHKIIHVDTVQRVVEEFYHVSHEELVGKRRTANIAFARHVAVYLANKPLRDDHPGHRRRIRWARPLHGPQLPQGG